MKSTKILDKIKNDVLTALIESPLSRTQKTKLMISILGAREGSLNPFQKLREYPIIHHQITYYLNALSHHTLIIKPEIFGHKRRFH